MAPIHVVIVPIFKTDEQRAAVLAACERLKKAIEAVDIADEQSRYRDFLAVEIDARDMRPGAKFYEWERRGVPLRIELGPKDLEKGQVCAKMRVDSAAGTGKEFVSEAQFLAGVRDRMRLFQSELLDAARKRREQATRTIDDWGEFLRVFDGDDSTFAWCHWDGTAETEAAIKAETKVTVRCVPLPGQGPEPEPGKCIKTGKPSPQRVLMAKAY